MPEVLKIGVAAEYDPALQKAYEERAGEEFTYIKSAGITGETAAWVVIATLGVQALPPIVDFVKLLIERHQIKSLQFGDLKIENPSREDVALFEEQARRKALK